MQQVALQFACLSTPEQVRAADSALLEDFTPSKHTRGCLHSLLESHEGLPLSLVTISKGRSHSALLVRLSDTLKVSGLL